MSVSAAQPLKLLPLLTYRVPPLLALSFRSGVSLQHELRTKHSTTGADPAQMSESLSGYFLFSHAVSLHCSLSPFAQAFLSSRGRSSMRTRACAGAATPAAPSR